VRYAEDVRPGDNLPRLVKHPTTRQLVQYAGASGDFYEIHYDRPYAERAGLPGVIIHGLLKAGWLGELVRAWAGADAWIRRLSVSYRGIDEPGQPYTVSGTVTAVEPTADGGRVTLELWGESADGRRTTLGTAEVDLPGRRPA
jgi:acyl dehydratase